MSLRPSLTITADHDHRADEPDPGSRHRGPTPHDASDRLAVALRGALTDLMRMHAAARRLALADLLEPQRGAHYRGLTARPAPPHRGDPERPELPVDVVVDDGVREALRWMREAAWLAGAPLTVDETVHLLIPAGDIVAGDLDRVDADGDALHVIHYVATTWLPRTLVDDPMAGAEWLSCQAAAAIQALFASGRHSRPVSAVTWVFPLCRHAVTWQPEPEVLDTAAIWLLEELTAIKLAEDMAADPRAGRGGNRAQRRAARRARRRPRDAAGSI